MSKERISGSEALMRSLEHEGVKTIFGYPKIVFTPSCSSERISASDPDILSLLITLLFYEA